MATAEAQIGVNRNLQKQDLSNLVSSQQRRPPDAAFPFFPPVCESIRVVIMEPLPGKTAGCGSQGRAQIVSNGSRTNFEGYTSGFRQGQQ